MNKQKFDKLQEQLHDHHIKCIGNDATRSPLFLVQVKKVDYGYESEYATEHAIHFDESYYYTADEFYDCHELSTPEELEYFLNGVTSESAKVHFRESYKEWDLFMLMEWVDCCLPDSEYELVHGNYRWETINYFITREQAENFMSAKAGKDNPNTRVIVDSLYRSSEFETLLEAIAEGKLVWKGE